MRLVPLLAAIQRRPDVTRLELRQGFFVDRRMQGGEFRLILILFGISGMNYLPPSQPKQCGSSSSSDRSGLQPLYQPIPTTLNSPLWQGSDRVGWRYTGNHDAFSFPRRSNHIPAIPPWFRTSFHFPSTREVGENPHHTGTPRCFSRSHGWIQLTVKSTSN